MHRNSFSVLTNFGVACGSGRLGVLVVLDGDVSVFARSPESVFGDGSLDAKNAIVVEVGLDLTSVDAFGKRELAADFLVDLVVAVLRLLATLGVNGDDVVVDADFEIFRSKVVSHAQVDETLLVVAVLNDARSDAGELVELVGRDSNAEASDAGEELVDGVPSAEVAQRRVPGVDVSAVTREW